MRHRNTHIVKPSTPRCRLVGAVVGAVALVTLAACGSSADDASSGATISIVASTNVYGDIASHVAGDHAEVTSIIDNPNTDPHDYEASTRNMLAVERADIVIENGGGYDPFMQTLRDGADNSDAEVLDAVTISGKRAAPGEELNEHVWYDFAGMTRLIERLRDALVELDPTHAEDYRANADGLVEQLRGLQSRAEEVGSAHRGATAAMTEPVPGYLLDTIGIDNRTPDAFSEAVEAGEPASPAVLAETLALFTDDPVDVLVANAQTVDDQTGQVVDTARNNDVPVVSVTETLPEGESYVTWMQANLTAIADALGGDPRTPATTAS